MPSLEPTLIDNKVLIVNEELQLNIIIVDNIYDIF